MTTSDGSYPITVDEMTVAVFPGFARVTVTKVIIAESAGAYAVTVDNPEHVIIPDSVYPSEFVTTGEEAHDFLAACAVAAYWSNQIYEANV